MFGRKKAEPIKPGLFNRMQERHGWWKITGECFPGGIDAFEAKWEEEPRSAFLQLMDALKAKDMVGMTSEMVKAYWEKLPKEDQEGIAAMMVENWLRIERQLEKRGMSGEALLKTDWDESEKEALRIMRDN